MPTVLVVRLRHLVSLHGERERHPIVDWAANVVGQRLADDAPEISFILLIEQWRASAEPVVEFSGTV